MIIGISGKIGSGKDTVGKIIQDLTKNSYQQSPWQIKKFAGKLKQIVSLLTGIPVEDLEKQEVKDRVLGEEWTKFGVDGDHDFSPEDYGFVATLNEAKELARSCNEEEQFIKEYSMTVRTLLQRVGTEAMRDQVHPNIWVNALFSDYKNEHTIVEKILNRGVREGDEDWQKGLPPKWIITDVRFPNEAQAIKDRGGIVIRVIRVPDQKAADFHTSETALDDYNFDEVIYNTGTIEDLKEKVRTILIRREL